ncbi:MAG: hypothetical protein J5885_04920 [Clostridia bacterium]|nr:hypothetical protein [Clostridia bacterium]
MEKKNRMIRQVGFLILLSILFVLFAVSSAAVTTPWIEVPDDSGTEATTETETPTDVPATQETAVATETPPQGIPIVEIPVSENETTAGSGTETPSERSAGAPKKRGCGSTIPQSGVGFGIFMIGITEIVCLIRKEKQDESAN